MAKGDTLERARALISEGPPPSNGGAWNVQPDIDEARRTVGRSFAGNDQVPGEPWMEWGANHIDYPDPETKVEVCTFCMSFPLLDGVRKDAMIFRHQTDDKADKDGAVTSVLAVLEYDSNKEKRKWFKTLRRKWAGFLTVAYVAKRDGVPEFFKSKKYKHDTNRFMKKMEDGFHNHYIYWHHEVGPKKKHWCVEVFGVDPSQQGKGHGKMHMTRLNQAADELGMAQYLECGGEKNRSFYEKMGYVVVESKDVKDPTDPENGEPMLGYLMIREPKPVNH